MSLNKLCFKFQLGNKLRLNSSLIISEKNEKGLKEIIHSFSIKLYLEKLLNI